MALPALIVGGGATLLAAYGTLVLPEQLPNRYSAAYQQTASQYASLKAKPRVGSSEIFDTAGELDVIFNRLVSLESNNTERYWQWYEFLTAHRTLLLEQLQDPAASLQKETRQQLESQAQRFAGKAREILEQLAVGNSRHRAPAVLHIAKQDFARSLSQGVFNAEALAAELMPLAQDSAQLSPDEVEQSQLLLIRLQIEAAWYATPSSRLVCSQSKLDQARESFENFAAAAGNAREIQWSALDRLLRELSKQDHESIVPAPGTPHMDPIIAANPLWDHLAELELAACAGDWTQVGYLLSGKVDSENSPLFAATARTICRLVCSPMAQRDEVWLARSGQGLQLAAQLAPYLPEFAELLWLCSTPSPTLETTSEITAKVTPETRNDPPPHDFIATQAIVQAIAEGQSGLLKHTLFALTAALEDKPDVAKTHMELIQRGGANLQLLANVALWRSQQPPDPAENPSDLRLMRLLEDAAQLEPESGVNWLALGALRFRSGEAQAALEALKTSQELLGDLPAIKSLLEAAQKAVSQSR